MVASGDLIKTGFTEIDEIIGGFRLGSFNVVENCLVLNEFAITDFYGKSEQ